MSPAASAALPHLAIAPVSVLTRGMTTPLPTLHAENDAPAAGSAAHYTALLQRVGARQDRDAFVALFEYYAPRIKSYLMKNGADDATAEEAVQNTFVTVWEKAGGFNPAKASASTWIFTIARNKRIDALRRQKFVVPLDDDGGDGENAGTILSTLAAPVQEDYADAGTREQLHDAIDKLPPEQSRLLRMAFFEDKSHQAISDETALPLGTVKSRLRLAMDKLRHSLKAGDAP